MRKHCPVMKSSSLYLIHELLIDKINRETIGKAIGEGTQAKLEYAIDKVFFNI